MSLIILSSNTSWYLLNFRKNTILRLLAAGCRVVCLAPEDEYSAKLVELGAEFIAVPLDGKSVGPVRELKSLLAIFSIVKKLQPDFVYNFTIKMNLYVGLSCRALRIPYSNNVSGLGTVFLHQGLAYKLARQLYGVANKGAQRVFFQNPEDLQIFLEAGLAAAQKTDLLPGSGIDVQHYAAAPLPEEGLPFCFIMIARLIADKGVREYIAAARLAKAKNPALRFLLVGPGGISNTSAIGAAEIAQWQEEAVVDYVGNQDDVIPWLQQAHALVLPSYREGMPRTVLEGASLGRPAIVTDVPGCRQSIVDGETGWLCQVQDADDLGRVMLMVADLSRDVMEAFAGAARLRIENEFDEELVIEAYLACLTAAGVALTRG